MGKNIYTKELKVKIIEDIKEGKYTVEKASRRHLIHESAIRKWIIRYEMHGIEGLERKHRSYTAEFKEEVIKDMNNNNLSLREAANKYNIGVHTSIKQWEIIYKSEGIEGLRQERRGLANEKSGTLKGKKAKFKKEEKEDLVSEVKRLRMENEYLKKLNALIQ